MKRKYTCMMSGALLVATMVWGVSAAQGECSKNAQTASAKKSAVQKGDVQKTTATPAAEKAKDGDDTLVIKARLVEIPGTFPPNDLYNYVYVMKYRVLKVVKGTYKDREILVGHYNPLIPRKQITDKMDPYVDGNVESFEEGDKHTLTLIKPISTVWKEAMEDEYFDVKKDKYYALKAEVTE